MIWLMEVLRIYLKEEFLIKYYLINCLILLKIQIMMDINELLLREKCLNTELFLVPIFLYSDGIRRLTE